MYIRIVKHRDLKNLSFTVDCDVSEKFNIVLSISGDTLEKLLKNLKPNRPSFYYNI